MSIYLSIVKHYAENPRACALQNLFGATHNMTGCPTAMNNEQNTFN
jgi:hypothetical protein